MNPVDFVGTKEPTNLTTVVDNTLQDVFLPASRRVMYLKYQQVNCGKVAYDTYSVVYFYNNMKCV